jgi:pyridoxine/pyridoxamine 5'-phosphate oxidase
MSYTPEEYTPTDNEIDEVLSLYHDWLDKAYDHHGDKEIAIDLATEKMQNDQEAGKVFSWVATNDAALIYDVDETISDDDIIKQ